MNRLFARLAISVATMLIASAGFMVALIFVIYAIYLVLLNSMEPWEAALATAGVAILFAMLVLLIGRLATRTRVPIGEKARLARAADLGELIGKQTRNFASLNSSKTLLGLLVAGFAIGVSPRLRALLMKIL